MTIDTARCETCGGARQIMPDGSPVEDFNADTAALASACPDCTEPAPSAGVSEKRLMELLKLYADDAARFPKWPLPNEIASAFTELRTARSRIAELEAGVRNALQQLDDDPEYSALRADIRALLQKESGPEREECEK